MLLDSDNRPDAYDDHDDDGTDYEGDDDDDGKADDGDRCIVVN